MVVKYGLKENSNNISVGQNKIKQSKTKLKQNKINHLSSISC